MKQEKEDSQTMREEEETFGIKQGTPRSISANFYTIMLLLLLANQANRK